MTDRTTVRSRSFPFKMGKGHVFAKSWYWPDGYNTARLDIDKDVRITGPAGSQVTASEGHPFHGRNAFGYDVGGPFDTTKREIQIVGSYNNSLRFFGRDVDSGYEQTFKGPIVPIKPANLSYPTASSSSDIALAQKGATAVARCSPSNPIANLSTFLGELIKDGIPAIPGARTWEAKALAAKLAGEEFLNVVFGWKPLMGDIQSTAKAVRHANTVLKQFERDAGKAVRRRYTFDTIESRGNATLLFSGNAPFIGEDSNGTLWNMSAILGSGQVWKVSENINRTWFSGAFTYHLPTGYNSRKALDRAALEANRVFGLELTPEVLWNLAPWSWALDWVSNAGDVLKNISQHIQYGQVLRYGYIMENIISRDIYSYLQKTPPVHFAGNVSVPMLILETNTKKRRGANPFGFGLTWSGLTATQQAIAAALGLTRSRS
ncbi:maturation protein [ssRNA phage Gerhypos.1_39]|uniref:Maturation protein n=2 Tax=Leviviricetes TaxID=2842243 RepID=A0A8S5L397_9VIRU|nr:maturation protein [ssRNA phage Gerhypos.1_39]QDH90503.1 MAG: hypothetical protein H1Bulk30199_000003 [Leviviridae sp.]DAD51642.1 TPA_asm: maturation protein [ssRNA phage Gerhypos.1_39]